MPHEIFLPRLSQTMETGRITEWAKAVGAPVAKGETLLTVESDKSAIELEAEVDGTLGAVLHGVGDEVEIGATLGWILLAGEGMDAVPAPGVAPPAPAAAPVAAPAAPAPSAPPARGAAQATPVARKLAAEHGIDLATLAGTGPDGRITKEDVLAAAAQGETEAAPASRIVPIAGIRRTIAERMMRSVRESAPVALSAEVELEHAEAARRRGQGLTLTHLVAWAACRALADHPDLNGWVHPDRIEHPPGIHLGVAVSTPRGLIVPVLRDAGRLSLAELAAGIRAQAEQARADALPPGAAAGSSFTISTLGAQGVDVFAPIINPPEIAILGIGRAARRAVVRDDRVAIAQTAFLTLVFDHRAVDGDAAGRALAAIKAALETGSFA